MKKYGYLIPLLLFVLTHAYPVNARDVAADAAAIHKAAGIHGGLCLLGGEKDTALAEALTTGSALYAQVLMDDQPAALKAARDLGTHALREQIGVRLAAFDPNHYGSNLLNLVVWSTWPPKAPSADDLKRILTPHGLLMVRDAPAAFVASAEASGLTPVEAAQPWVAFKKSGTPPAFAPTDSLRWRAGARWQLMHSGDFTSVKFGAGKLIYRESMAGPNGTNFFELICRDAYNGRALWKISEGPVPDGKRKSLLRRGMGLAIDSKGRVYTGQGQDLVCLDGGTGKTLSTIIAGGRTSNMRVVQDKFLLAGGRIYDLAGNKEVGRYSGRDVVVIGDILYSSDGKQVTAQQISDGKVIWKVVPKDQPPGQFADLFSSANALHIRRSWPAASISTMDPKTGKTLWTYPPPPRPKVRDVHAYPVGDRIYLAYGDKSIKEPHDFVLREVEALSGKVVKEGLYGKGKKWAGGCWNPRRAGDDYIVYHHNTWFNLKTQERTHNVMFRPKCNMGPLPALGLLYGFPGRKGSAVKGIAALAPSDIAFDHEPGGKVRVKLGDAPSNTQPAGEKDWPNFRGNGARTHGIEHNLGKTLKVKWSTQVSKGGRSFGTMDSERTGLAQATVAWGRAYVADLDGQRVVSLDAESGKVAWTFHLGSRIAFSPTLHNGLCLVGAKDGWVYALNAENGAPVYKVLAAPAERFIGGEELLESMWPVQNDLLVIGDTAFVTAGISNTMHGGVRVTAFKAATGETCWTDCVHGHPAKNDGEMVPGLFVANKDAQVIMGSLAYDTKTGKSGRRPQTPGLLSSPNMEDWLSTNNLERISEDMGTASLQSGHKEITGRLVAFNNTFGAGFSVARVAKSVLHIGTITLNGRSVDGKIKWGTPTDRLNIDDLLVDASHIYCVGHYVEGDKPPELRVISQADGSIVATHTIDGFPAYNGLSAAGNNLYLATRDGKLICLEGR